MGRGILIYDDGRERTPGGENAMQHIGDKKTVHLEPCDFANQCHANKLNF